MTLRVGLAAPADRAQRYRAEGLWGGRKLRDGVEAAAERRPRALALADGELRLTYEELAGLVAKSVARLASHGVRAGDGVVLIAGNTADAVVAYHALLRTGAVVVLLDRRCGPSDVRVALETLRIGARVLVPAAERERLLPAHADVLELEVLRSETSPTGPGATGSEPDRGAPAVVLFTSVTTSRPKGVVHSLDTLTAGAANMARITGAGEETVAFLVSPLASITGVMQMHLVADTHAALVLEDCFEPDAALDRINALGATLLGGAPVIAERLLRAASARTDRRIALRTLALGGAMLPRPLLDQASNEFGIEIARVYGSSEAPNFSGSIPGDGMEQRLCDDGALMPGSEVRIGSANHAQEGMLRGPSLFLGYADPDDDADAFEDGWYRTGDLVEVNGGRLTVIGRLKEIANRSGLKISLAEIDAALTGLLGAREHACFALPDAETGEHLAVAVLPEGGTALTLDDVVSHLRAGGLARRKLPEQLVVWDGPLPRTASGKVVRSRLQVEWPTKPSQCVPRLREGRGSG
ncbi:MAG: cyclohexanecarboxylate-CoA ligase [Deltaproteobacteria bacterium]|nr:MAG: cyclohexanecarboxylate-CoA ligase [Deltaproteobacteria bacterium]